MTKFSQENDDYVIKKYRMPTKKEFIEIIK